MLQCIYRYKARPVDLCEELSFDQMEVQLAISFALNLFGDSMF